MSDEPDVEDVSAALVGVDEPEKLEVTEEAEDPVELRESEDWVEELWEV